MFAKYSKIAVSGIAVLSLLFAQPAVSQVKAKKQVPSNC